MNLKSIQRSFVTTFLRMTVIFLLLPFYFLLVTPVFAHLAGQPPYFKINGVYANLYPVPLSSLYDFNLPQDLAPENYLVNQEISFEIDTTVLPVTPEIVKKTTFTWDLGDNTKGQGLKLTHSYTKPGSYILDIYANDNTTPSPQLLEKALLNILPDKNYQLPKAIIKINGQNLSNPSNDSLKIDFNQPVHLDASTSQAGSGKIVSYFWDFGDQQSSETATIDHNYSKQQPQIFPVLRIKDENGFISDAFSSIQNQELTGTNPFQSSKPSQQPASNNHRPSQLKYTLIVLGVLSFLAAMYVLVKKTRE